MVDEKRSIPGGDLARRLEEISTKCIDCRLCRRECRFLQRYGSPKAIAESYDPSDEKLWAMPFQCSLCGLCAAVCPVRIDPSRMFLEMRREAARNGEADYRRHSVILNYEKRGMSRRYTWYGLPEGCDTVLFPGCTLAGTRPGVVLRLFEHLKKSVPALGIVLDCCAKPSHDLGRQAFFETAFGKMSARLAEKGVRTVLLACPSCHSMFKAYGGEIEARTVYEIMDMHGLPEGERISGTAVLHDACAMRFESSVHEAVRSMARARGVEIEEMPHCREKTLCCGEGGSTPFVAPDFAGAWSALRKKEAADARILTCCAGCLVTLGKIAPTTHLLDLVFEPEAAMAGKTKPSRAPFTYWNRLRLKSRFKKLLADASFKSERTWR